MKHPSQHTGDLIGFVGSGGPDLNYATLQKLDEVASHILVFLVRSAINPLKFSLANFATSRLRNNFFTFVGHFVRQKGETVGHVR